MTLRQKTLFGVLWTFTDTFLVKGIFFVAMLFLARWLGPIEFGLIGMISIFIGIGISLVDSGLSASIIRTKDVDNKDYSTVFYMNLLMSFLIYIILFITAPLIAQFYNQEVLINLIRLYCLSFIISAFSAIQLAILNKEMQFKNIFKYNSLATIIGVAVGLSLGYNGYGVWSIVWMYLSTQTVMSLCLWYFSSWKPTLLFSKEKMRFHYNFGYKLMLAGLLDQVYNNIYNVIIGKFFAVQILGFYERAKSLSDYPNYALTGIIGKVTYPLLSKIQDDKERIGQVYKNLLQLIFFISAPLMLGAVALARPLFILLLGEKWLPAVPFFQILSLAAMLYPVHAFNLNVLKVYGRSDLFLKLEIIKKVVITISILIAFQFGVIGLIWSSVFTSFISLLINTHYSSQMINYSVKRQLLDMFPILIISLAMYILMGYIISLLESYHSVWQIFSASITGIITYLAINYIFKTIPMKYILNLLKYKTI